jgi:hypothetical protein
VILVIGETPVAKTVLPTARVPDETAVTSIVVPEMEAVNWALWVVLPET